MDPVACAERLRAEVSRLRAQVAELEQAQKGYLAEQARHRALLDAIPDLIIRLRHDGIYLDFVAAKGMPVLMSAAARLGRSVREILPPDVANLYMVAIERALRGGQTQSFDYQLDVGGRIGEYEARVAPCGSSEAVLVIRDVTERRHAELLLRQEKERSEELLLNILPRSIAEQLKHSAGSIAQRFEQVSILFADIVGFTELAGSATPMELVDLLNEIFSSFDRVTERCGLEKIKTIGDAYMVVSGVPTPRSDHAEAIAEMALIMNQEIRRFHLKGKDPFSLRIGINSGPVVAGVIGMRKFIYDLWGDAVNVASRMESHGQPGRIQVTEETYELLKERYVFEKRGAITIKGKGQMSTYFLLGIR